MAVTDAYCTAAEYRAIVNKTDTADDAEILADLKAVSRLIDQKTDRFFTKDAAVVARVYATPAYATPYRDPFFITPWNGSTSVVPLEVDDIATTAGLIVRADTTADGVFGETAWAVTDYELEPRNAAVGPEPRPYTHIAVPVWSTQGGFAASRVQITAVWGWPAVPDAIVRATAHLTGILRLESPRATSRVSEMGDQISTSKAGQDIIKELVRAYRRSSIVFA